MVRSRHFKKYKFFQNTLAFPTGWGTSVLWFCIHAGLPGVLGEARQRNQEEDDSEDEEQDEGGTGTGKGPGVTVLNPDCLLAVNHPFHRLSHDFNRDDDAET